MYEIRCEACGFEEAGMFVPSSLGMPEAKPVEVRIQLGGMAPTGKNLLALSKLHPKLGRLGPAELKALFLSGPVILLGALRKEEAERAQKAAINTGFVVLCAE
ncbi:hypothetical protein AACH06_29960 [Ideonella sp. DXS29W]|uniref:Uncharacterized protein n=1 Tax=Ideonella lacteola TaxID=2984193 RepID=A0ABU9BYJ4_9BURK